MHRRFSVQGLGTAFYRVKIIKVQMMVFVKKVNHQVNNYIVSQTMLLTCFPVYIWDFKQYPVPVSYKTHSFMPSLVDFLGMYYTKEILQRVPTFRLSMDKWILDPIALKTDCSNGLAIVQVCSRVYTQDLVFQAGLHYLISASRQVL